MTRADDWSIYIRYSINASSRKELELVNRVGAAGDKLVYHCVDEGNGRRERDEITFLSFVRAKCEGLTLETSAMVGFCGVHYPGHQHTVDTPVYLMYINCFTISLRRNSVGASL